MGKAKITAPFAMILGVLAVYVPLPVLTSRFALVGIDYFQLHFFRIRYAEEAMRWNPFAAPGWFTREVLGTPFLANIQSFPWIPTRLLLFLLDSNTAYVVAVALAASLTAWFTYLFARAARLSPFASAAAGWTFACSGFFASRMMAGHLAILEAFSALPCLLWLADRYCKTESGSAAERRELLVLALATACFAVAGHPQIPAYAIVAALAYVSWRDRTRALRVGAGMLLGCGLTLFAWWPVLRFVGRSSRVLLAGHPTNDVVFPWWRLGAFLLPWKDGWTVPVMREPLVPFIDSNPALFWDTVCYTGILPLGAALFLVVLMLRKQAVDEKIRFALYAGAIALIVALPPIGTLMSSAPVVIFRSSSRLLYFTEFALALALAAVVDRLFAAGASGKAKFATGIAIALLAVHAIDLGHHAKAYVRLMPLPRVPPGLLDPFLSSVGPDDRVAIDHTIPAEFNRTRDDVGFYDSLMPAHTYQALMALAGHKDLPSTELFDGSSINGAALEQLGVKLVLTQRDKPEMQLVRKISTWKVYLAHDPVPRATFVAGDRVRYLPDAEILETLRTRGLDLRSGMLLPSGGDAPQATASQSSDGAAGVEPRLMLRRTSSDELSIAVETPVAGFVRLTESWDAGWHAFLDDQPIELVRAEGFLMSVRVPRGAHVVHLVYVTPGRGAGAAASVISLIVLAGLLVGKRGLSPSRAT